MDEARIIRQVRLRPSGQRWAWEAVLDVSGAGYHYLLMAELERQARIALWIVRGPAYSGKS